MSEHTEAGVHGSEDDLRERYRELLEELRTILPGVQVLLAFLLTVPFASRFTELDRLGTLLFLLSLGAAASSVIVFLVPAVTHRLTPSASRAERLRLGVRTVLAGLAILAVSIVLALVVVARFIYDASAAWAVAGTVSVGILVLWVVVPVARHRRRRTTPRPRR